MPQFKLWAAYKLVARVERAVGGHGQVLPPGSAAGEALVDAGPLVQVHGKMEKEKGIPFPGTLQAKLRQGQVLLPQAGQVLPGEGMLHLFRGDHRFQGDETEALLVYMANIFQEIKIPAGIGPPDIVAPGGSRATYSCRLRSTCR